MDLIAGRVHVLFDPIISSIEHVGSPRSPRDCGWQSRRLQLAGRDRGSLYWTVMNTRLHWTAIEEDPTGDTVPSGEPRDPTGRPPSLADERAMSPIRPEPRWRQAPPGLLLPGGRVSGISLSRWSAAIVPQPVETYQDAVEGAHVISIAVRRTLVDFSDGHLEVRDTAVREQTLLLTPPTSSPRRGVFHRPYDVVRAFISQQLLKECWESIYGETRSQDLALFKTHFSQHSDLTQLMRCVLNADASLVPLDLVFLEALGLALSSQLLRIGIGRRPGPRRRTALSEGLLRRAIEYIDAHLAQPIYLAELANVVGLSRMYFAAQFRAATGLAPHAFILQRRIDRSKALLHDVTLSIGEIALSTGFNGQAHFTEGFRKVVGDTPYRWRKAQLGDGNQGPPPNLRRVASPNKS